MDQNRLFVKHVMHRTSAAVTLPEFERTLQEIKKNSGDLNKKMLGKIEKMREYLDDSIEYIEKTSSKIEAITEAFNKQIVPAMTDLKKIDSKDLTDKQTEMLADIDEQMYDFKKAYEYLTEITEDVNDILDYAFEHMSDTTHPDYSREEKNIKNLDNLAASIEADLNSLLKAVVKK